MELVGKQYFESIEVDRYEDIKLNEQMIKKGISEKNVYTLEWLEFDYSTLAIVQVCLHCDFEKAKEYYYTASLIRTWIIENYAKYREQISVNMVTTYSYLTLYYGILSGNFEHAKYRATLFGKYSELETDEFEANMLLGYTLKYVILNDKENALIWSDKLNKLKDKRGMKQLVAGHGRAMWGLIEMDEKEFNAGLQTMLKNHVGRMKKSGDALEEYFAFDSVALAMLAKERGIQITVKHDLLPMEYLEYTNIDYKKIEEKCKFENY